MISKQAQDFWTLLKSYPKQIEMPLAQAREADLHAEDFTSEPKGVAFSPAPEVDGLWAEPPDAAFFIFFAADWCSAHPPRDERPLGISRSPRKRAFSFRIIALRRKIPLPRRSR